MNYPKEILTKAIQKAIDNGYKTKFNAGELTIITMDAGREYNLIFNHSFAKALWGEKPMIVREIHTNPFAQEGDEPDVVDTLPAWQGRLQQMVIFPDPITYLGEHIDV